MELNQRPELNKELYQAQPYWNLNQLLDFLILLVQD